MDSYSYIDNFFKQGKGNVVAPLVLPVLEQCEQYIGEDTEARRVLDILFEQHYWLLDWASLKMLILLLEIINFGRIAGSSAVSTIVGITRVIDMHGSRYWDRFKTPLNLCIPGFTIMAKMEKVDEDFLPKCIESFILEHKTLIHHINNLKLLDPIVRKIPWNKLHGIDEYKLLAQIMDRLMLLKGSSQEGYSLEISKIFFDITLKFDRISDRLKKAVISYENKIPDNFEKIIMNNVLHPVALIFPEIINDENAEVFNIIVDLAIAIVSNNLDLSYFIDFLCIPFFTDHKDDIFSGKCVQLQQWAQRIMIFAASGVLPINSVELSSDPKELIDLMKEFDYRPADFSILRERYLYYLYLKRSIPSLVYSDYIEVVTKYKHENISPIPQYFGRLAISGNRIQLVLNDPSRFAEVRQYRDAVLGMYKNPVLLRDRIASLVQLGPSKRSFISRQENLDGKSLAEIAVKLAGLNFKNYQRDYAVAINEILTVVALMEETNLAIDMENDNEEVWSQALKQVVDDRIVETGDRIFSDLYREIIGKIESRLNISLSIRAREEFNTSHLRDKIKMINNELKLINNIISVSTKLKELVSLGYGVAHEDDEILACILFINDSQGNGLGLLKGFTGFRGKALLVRKTKINYPFFILLIDSKEYILKALDGQFVDILRDSRSSTFQFIIQAMNSVLALTDRDIDQARRIVSFLQKHILPILNPVNPTVTRKINKALQYRRNTSAGKDEILLVPAKDFSMAFRGYVGRDCSKRDISQLYNEDAFFYKVIHEDMWKGYITLLRLKNNKGESVLLIDVINIDGTVNMEWDKVFSAFVSYLATVARKEKFSFILISASKMIISNKDFIRDRIEKLYKEKRIISKNEFQLFSGSKLVTKWDYPMNFQSFRHDFRVIWE